MIYFGNFIFLGRGGPLKWQTERLLIKTDTEENSGTPPSEPELDMRPDSPHPPCPPKEEVSSQVPAGVDRKYGQGNDTDGNRGFVRRGWRARHCETRWRICNCSVLCWARPFSFTDHPQALVTLPSEGFLSVTWNV